MRSSGIAARPPRCSSPAQTRSWRPGEAATGEQLLDLQRQAGNAAVAEMVEAQQGTSERPMLRQGSQGDDVRDLQNILNQKDEVTLVLAIDGIFGPLTAAAVRQFQAAHPPLAADAIVGPLTWAELEAAQATPEDDAAMARKLFQAGSDAYTAGRFAHAYDFMTRAEELVPNKPAIVFARGQCLRRLGARREEAIAHFERYLVLAPTGSRVAAAAAALAELRGPAATGDTATDRAAAVALFERANTLYTQGQYAHAYDELSKADALMPNKPSIVFNRGQCLRRLGARREEAIALFERYLVLAPTGSRVAAAAAALAELRGPAATGDAATDRAAAVALFERANTLYTQGQYAQAYDELSKADALMPNKPSIVFNRGQCLRRLGARREEAIALFERYLVLAPTGSRARHARIYADALRTQGAAP